MDDRRLKRYVIMNVEKRYLEFEIRRLRYQVYSKRIVANEAIEDLENTEKYLEQKQDELKLCTNRTQIQK